MDHWNEYAYPKITARARQDNIYLELLTENRILEQKYRKLMEKMGEAEQEMVDSYIASCEDLEFRLTQIAYQVGRSENNRTEKTSRA